MKLLKNLFKKKEKVKLDYDVDDFKKIKKKNRKGAIKLLAEYNRGLVIEIGKDINQKDLMMSKRKEK